MRPPDMARPWIKRQKIKYSIDGESPEARAAPANKKSVSRMIGLRPKRSDAGPSTSWPTAFPSITVDMDAITRLGVEPSPSAILGTPAKNMSMPIGPNMFKKPNIIVRNKSALPLVVIFFTMNSYKKAGGAWPPAHYQYLNALFTDVIDASSSSNRTATN